VLSERDDPRAVAEAVFRERLGPVLALAERHPDATDVFIDGDAIRLSLGDERLLFGFGDFPGLTPRAVEAAGAAAAVFAGVEFGPRPPALPLFSVKVPPDLRVTFVRPPAADGWHVDVRFLRTRALTLEDYWRQGVMTADQMSEIRQLLADRKTIIVSGGTGTGKTTLLRALLAEIADRERLVIIEDTPELAVPGENVVQLQTALNVDLAQLLRQTLRLTPDRIVLGEVRGPEALELVRAMNTGHDGTLCTLHSNGAGEALRRLHTLVAEAQPGFPFGGVLSAVDHVLQLEGRGDRRRLADIWPVPRGGSGEEHGR
jgi:type II/IV secretion system protein